MRVGTLLNTYKIAPKVLYDLFGTETDLVKKALWFLQHSPKVFLHWAVKFLHLAEFPEKGFALQTFFEQFELRKQIEELREAGATHFELSSDLVFLLPSIEEWWREQLPYLTSLRADGVTYSVHLPQFAGLNIDSYMPGIRSSAVLDVRRMNEFFRELNPLYVLHLGAERFFKYLGGHLANPALDRELEHTFGSGRLNRLKIAGARRLIQELMAFSKRFIIERVVDTNTMRSLEEIKEFLPVERVCLENLEYTDFDAVMKPLMMRPDLPVSVWLDTGHLMIQKWLQDTRCFEKFFDRYRERLAGLHIHNVIETSREVYEGGESEPILQDHKPLDIAGGLLPLQEILHNLKMVERRTGKDLPLVVELYYHDPLSSVRFLKDAIDHL